MPYTYSGHAAISLTAQRPLPSSKRGRQRQLRPSQRLATILAGGRARPVRDTTGTGTPQAYPGGVSPTVLPLAGADPEGDCYPLISPADSITGCSTNGQTARRAGSPHGSTGVNARNLSSTPVSRPNLVTRRTGMSLQSWSGWKITSAWLLMSYSPLFL